VLLDHLLPARGIQVSHEGCDGSTESMLSMLRAVIPSDVHLHVQRLTPSSRHPTSQPIAGPKKIKKKITRADEATALTFQSFIE
jgi:hypothetical protein